MSTDLRAFLARHRRFSRLVDDVAVTEIRVDETGDVRARKNGKPLETEGLGRTDAKALFEAVGPPGKSSAVELGLHRWVRVEPPDVRPGPLLFATRVREARLTPSELVASEYIEPKQLDALSAAVEEGKGVMVVGTPLACPGRLMGTLLARACDDGRHVVVLERRSSLDTTGLQPTCLRRASVVADGALKGLAGNADVVVMDDVAAEDWELAFRREGAASLLLGVEVADHQVALLEAVRRYLACTGADHVRLPSEAGIHMVAACTTDGEVARVRAVYEVPDKPLTASTKYLSLKPVGGERKPLVPSKDTQELPPIIDLGEEAPASALEAKESEAAAKASKAVAAAEPAQSADPAVPAPAVEGAAIAEPPSRVARVAKADRAASRAASEEREKKPSSVVPKRLKPVATAPPQPRKVPTASAQLPAPDAQSPLSVDSVAEPPTADEPPAPSLDEAPEKGQPALASTEGSSAPSSSVRKVRSSGRGGGASSAASKASGSRVTRRASARRAKRTEPMAVLPAGTEPGAATGPDALASASADPRPAAKGSDAEPPKGSELQPAVGSGEPATGADVPAGPGPAAAAVAALGSDSTAGVGAVSAGETTPPAKAPDEASLRMRRRLGRPPAGQAWARTESVAKSSSDLPDAETEEVASVAREPAPKADEGRLRPMPRAKGISRSAGNRSDSANDARRTPAEGMRARRLMTTGVVDRLPRPRKEEEPQERRTGAVRRLSRFGGAIDRQASFKPPEPSKQSASGLRDAGVEVHMGGAASGASSTAATTPGAEDDDIVTIQRPASELMSPAAEARDSDDTAELRIEELTPKIVDEDDVTRERKVPPRGK